jgi:hypothetical protein
LERDEKPVAGATSTAPLEEVVMSSLLTQLCVNDEGQLLSSFLPYQAAEKRRLDLRMLSRFRDFCD